MSAYSSTEICNSALQKIGCPRIQALNNESKESRICLSEYDKTRKQLLRMYPWGFATKREVLAPDPDPPAFEFSYRHQLPADFVRVVELYQYDGDYRVENFGLYCDSDTVYLRYIYDVKDLGTADPLFVDALEWLIAHKISRYLTESESVREEAWAGFRSVLPLAKFIQSTEHSQRYLEADDLIDARLQGRGFVRDPMT